jgi:hypothetical protein
LFCAVGARGGTSAERAIGGACGMQQPQCLDTRECDIEPALGDAATSPEL